MRVSKIILYVTLISATGGCGSSPSSPTQPSGQTAPPQQPVQLAVFMDPASSYTTSDVLEAQRRIVRFDTANNALIWVADNRSFSGFPVSGNFVRSDKNFQIRFGTENGERRAYFTETASETICNVEIVNGQPVISPTSQRVPGA
jgi:hypothetical protein